MVVVKSTEDEGVCFVETKNLDGETNLKNKCVPKDLWSSFDHPIEAI
jgi:magnesium-transporting ATPase (P-type)